MSTTILLLKISVKVVIPFIFKWNAAKQSEFVESIFNNETAFGELDYIFSEQCEGNQAKEIVNRVVNKIGDFF
jgi:hypothetical protein